MNAHDKVDAAIREVENLRKVLKKGVAVQVTARDELDLAKATALAWFNSHLPVLQPILGEDTCGAVNTSFHALLGFTDRSTTRNKYDTTLKALKKELSALRKQAVDGGGSGAVVKSSDVAPDFSPLISDPKMQAILSERWDECVACLNVNAPLASVVMMGGLLETLMLARFNRETDKTPIFSATTAPQDKKTKKTLQLKEWTLRHYLDVGHELCWISRSTKDVGEVVRDFRNYVHPYKQVSHNVTLDTNDARLFWEISKEISRQLLENASIIDR
jgi:hypothetical protein